MHAGCLGQLDGSVVSLSTPCTVWLRFMPLGLGLSSKGLGRFYVQIPRGTKIWL